MLTREPRGIIVDCCQVVSACTPVVFVAVLARLTGLTSITLSMKGNWALRSIVLRRPPRNTIGRFWHVPCWVSCEAHLRAQGFATTTSRTGNHEEAKEQPAIFVLCLESLPKLVSRSLP
jgi:hypothetical protein